ncbi:MAG: helix-turn-helix transcriptional regulator [Deltaproteobacteria bacterium]|nr:helix-turn-helix transcriptional regulator [Deltaproteobacteria bacterium]
MIWVARAVLTAEELGAFRGRAVAAATQLFAERGYRGVTLRSLAKELGVSPVCDGADGGVPEVRRCSARFGRRD